MEYNQQAELLWTQLFEESEQPNRKYYLDEFEKLVGGDREKGAKLLAHYGLTMFTPELHIKAYDILLNSNFPNQVKCYAKDIGIPQ